MAMSSHVEQLKQKHSDLERQIEELMRHPSIEEREITELKRQKLQIKDKLSEIVH